MSMLQDPTTTLLACALVCVKVPWPVLKSPVTITTSESPLLLLMASAIFLSYSHPEVAPPQTPPMGPCVLAKNIFLPDVLSLSLTISKTRAPQPSQATSVWLPLSRGSNRFVFQAIGDGFVFGQCLVSLWYHCKASESLNFMSFPM